MGQLVVCMVLQALEYLLPVVVSHWKPKKVVPVKVKYVSRMAFMVQACCVSIRRRILVGGCHDISTRYLRCCTGVSQLCRI